MAARERGPLGGLSGESKDPRPVPALRARGYPGNAVKVGEIPPCYPSIPMYQLRTSIQGMGCRGLRMACAAFALAPLVPAQTTTNYTSSADFALGVLQNVNSNAPNADQLQLDDNGGDFSILSVACGGLNTVVRINTVSGEVLGEYLTVPGSMDGDPSRATTDLVGNAWVGNRLEDGLGGSTFGSVMQVGVTVGGTRVDANGVPNPNGLYLAPPYRYSTAVDRDGDGLIRTSRGLGDVMAWPDITDGLGGNPALVEDSEDELILIFQRTNPERVRHLAVDPATNELWAGGYPTFPTSFDRLDGGTGSFVSNLPAIPPGCGGFAGLIDSGGVLWSTSQFEGQVFRVDLGGGGAAVCVNVQNNVRGIAEAPDGFLWTAGGNTLVRISPDGTQSQTFSPAGASQLHGVAIDQSTGEVWVASSSSGEVFRLDSAGNLITKIGAGIQPRGLAFDAAGKLWVANQGSDNVMRIDVASNTVDMTVNLRAGARPYNPSDMTGKVTFNNDILVGNWSVITDAGSANASWTNVAWSEALPGNAQLSVAVRAADTIAGLAGVAFTPAGNNTGIANSGRFLEVSVDFQRATSGALESPVLFDLAVENMQEPGGERDCITAHRRQAGSLLVFPEYDTHPGSVTILTVSNVSSDSAGTIALEYVYIDGENCSEFNRTELLTPGDTLTLDTRYHYPGESRGFVYVFAKDPLSGEAIVANSLIGQSFTLHDAVCGDGRRSAGPGGALPPGEYTMNALVFQGIGDGDLTDIDQDGLRDLDGQEYEMAPAEILIPRFFAQADQAPGSAPVGFSSSLILLSLSGGTEFETTVDFLVYNDNEQVFSTEHTFHCWEKRSLLEVSGVFGQNFLSSTSHDPGELLGAEQIETGWMKIDGGVATSLSHTIVDPAFFAVLITQSAAGQSGTDLPFELCTQPGVLLPRDLTGGQ